jgi:hypothetical protein
MMVINTSHSCFCYIPFGESGGCCDNFFVINEGIGSGLLRIWFMGVIFWKLMVHLFWDFTLGLSCFFTDRRNIVCMCVSMCHVCQGECVPAAMESAIVCSYVSFSVRELWN